ncbi:hypothetical protein I4F81_012651 [Pyropia yezoensis]|uniref:Uncharacterized protein n=1 Tax=Pyropia yezoensis TaxID=2788 RepID=A0ACC3CK06_PYRYE|nr:hypothetical protein I4F81_012651 [Neopyropia yezoensis]
MAAFVSSSGAALTPRQPAVAACAARSSAFAGAAVAAVPARVVLTAPVAAPVLPVMPEIEAMRHRKKVAKLGKPADQRKALMRSLTTEIIRHGRVTTTLVRARAVRGHVDAMIGLAKEGSLHSRRQALGYIFDKPLVHSLFEAAPERYGERNGGYCRVLRTLPRRGDNAKMAVIELV